MMLKRTCQRFLLQCEKFVSIAMDPDKSRMKQSLVSSESSKRLRTILSNSFPKIFGGLADKDIAEWSSSQIEGKCFFFVRIIGV